MAHDFSTLSLTRFLMIGVSYVAEIDSNGLPSTPCYELTPYGFKGLREFSKTALQRFLRRKKLLIQVYRAGSSESREVIEGVGEMDCD
jgi:hypothetical protein